MIIDTVVRAMDSETADFERIIDVDEAVLQREKLQEKRDTLIAEIDRLQDRIAKLCRKREHFLGDLFERAHYPHFTRSRNAIAEGVREIVLS